MTVDMFVVFGLFVCLFCFVLFWVLLGHASLMDIAVLFLIVAWLLFS